MFNQAPAKGIKEIKVVFLCLIGLQDRDHHISPYFNKVAIAGHLASLYIKGEVI